MQITGSVQKKNMNYIHAKLNKLFILGIKSNRTVACSLDDKVNRNYQPVKSLDLKDGGHRCISSGN
nr:hypothetical protein [Piscirickettsia salmonis]